MGRARVLGFVAACAALVAACGGPGVAPPGGFHPATCTDGVTDGGETDVDCGGPCTPCGAGKTCAGGGDCASGVCTGATCAAPTCADGVRNGDETGVDCGGTICPPCGAGAACASGADCALGVCLAGHCDCGDATAVYVSAAAGSDANPGTAANPLRSVQGAVACAYATPREIRVAEGVYEGSGANPIVLQDGKSLVGGWSPDFALRDPAAHPSELRDTTDTGTTGTGVAVTVASTSTATVLDGFTVRATTLGAGLRATAIAVVPPHGETAGGTIRDDVLQCGGNPGILLARCVDLGTSGGDVVVEGNAIHLGTSDPAGGTSWGVYGQGVASVRIAGNVLDGGSSAAIVPLDLWVAPATSTVVEANDVRPGPGAEAGLRVQRMSGAATPAIRNNVVVVPGNAIGIDDGAGSEISNDTVVAATGPAIRMSVAGAALRNDALVTEAAGTCIAEAVPAAPSTIGANDLFGCGVPYLDGTGTPLALADVNALPGAAGNISLDPLLDPTTGYRPLPGSPLLGAGLDLSALFRTDKDGAVRTAPWSIGAYQGP